MSDETRTLETLAVAAHGAGVAVHALGTAYHLLRSKKFDRYAAIHMAALIFSAWSIRLHAKRLKP